MTHLNQYPVSMGELLQYWTLCVLVPSTKTPGVSRGNGPCLPRFLREDRSLFEKVLIVV